MLPPNITTPSEMHKGLFQYKRLIYGINSAFESFQKQIEIVLSGGKGAKNISDDVIIWGRSLDEHNEHLDEVLTRIEEHGLKINSKKCIFGATSLIFSGYKSSAYVISLDLKKVVDICKLDHQHQQQKLSHLLVC